MNISVNWLRELVPGLEAEAAEIARRITMSAVAVDAVEEVGEGLEGLVVARVLEKEPHPDADRLTLCRVDAGAEGAVEVVCGAPVVVQGALYPYVAPGRELPGGLRVESRKIRGQISHGMLCSEHELALGRDKGGILRLPEDLVPGQPLGPALGLPDARLVLDLTPNRVDLACHVGVARELAEDGDAGLVLRPAGAEWEPRWRDGAEEAEAAGVTVRVEDRDRCRRYLGAVIRGVTVRPSPAWLAGRLRALGLRPVNNVVDATNYVLHELNQPIHAFDLATLNGPEIRVRAAEAGERLRTLDGQDRELGPEVTVIADRDRATALAGVMGGDETEVTAGTRDLFLECAAFHPRYVRHTAKRVGLSTDASYRFERGIDETGLERALRRCVELILSLAGGEAYPAAARVGGPPPELRTAPLRPDRVQAVLGIRPGPVELRRMLGPLGFRHPEGSGDGSEVDILDFVVPGWRVDVTREIDLVEEVARRHGYEAFPREPRRFRASTVPDDPDWARADRVRSLLVGRGFFEARSSSFVPEERPGGRSEIRVLNPLSAAEGYLRSGLVPVLLGRLEHNFARGRRNVRLFEVGTTFAPRGEEQREGLLPGGAAVGAVREELRVALVMTGRRRPPHWGEAEEVLDVWDLKGIVEELAEGLCAGRAEPLPVDQGTGGQGPSGDSGGETDAAARLAGLWLGAERYRILNAEGETEGVAGRVRPEAVDAPPWAAPVWALELALEAVEAAPARVFSEISAFPAVRRDLAVTVPRDIPAGQVEAAIREASPELLESVRLFDVYEGEGIAEDRRSLAWSFRFRSPERTLTDEEADVALKRIVSALEGRFDARVRAS